MASADNNTPLALFNQLFQDAISGDCLPKGRWVWGRPVTASKPSMIHVETLPGDPTVNDLAIKSFSKEEWGMSSEDRKAIYRQRCVTISAELNERAVADNGLILLLKRNGEPTRRLRQLARAMRPCANTA